MEVGWQLENHPFTPSVLRLNATFLIHAFVPPAWLWWHLSPILAPLVQGAAVCVCWGVGGGGGHQVSSAHLEIREFQSIVNQ